MFEKLKSKKVFGKVIIAIVVMSLSGCGAVLQNPEIKTAEFQKELKKQTALLSKYQKKSKSDSAILRLFKSQYEYDAYLSNFMDNILVKNKDLCRHKMYSAGIQFSEKVVINPKGVGKSFQNFPQVYGISDNFPAVKSGLKKGDIILTLNNTKVVNMSVKDIAKKLNTRKNNALRVYRPSDKKRYSVKVAGKTSCEMLLYTYDDKNLNATADGSIVRMHSGLIDFLAKEQYIQAVLAHEVAHNILAHRYSAKRNSTTGLVLGALLGAVIANQNGGDKDKYAEDFSKLGAGIANMKYSHEFEAEADYLSVYLLARSGYKFNDVHNTWRRMSLLSSNTSSLGSTTTHPATPKRFVALTKTIKEIHKKQKINSALLPYFKESNLTEILNKQVGVY